MFHLDNIDFIEDTHDGKNTTHALQLRVFQISNSDRKDPLILDLNDTKELTLKPNSFNEIANCDKPCKNNFERTDGCCNFEGDIIHYQSPSLSKWVTLKSVEISFGNQFKNILANESRTTTEDYEPL